MKTFKNVLVGINYSDSSRYALQQAHRIARESKGTVFAFHAVPTQEINEFFNFYSIKREKVMNSAIEALERFVESVLGPDHGVTCRIEEGIPHREVATFANETAADLLVLGSHQDIDSPGKSGQFSIRCLRFVSMPVLLVRNQTDRAFCRLAACVDLSDFAKPVIENAARMNFSADQTVEIVHAVCPPWLRPFPIRYQIEVFENGDQKEQFHEIIDAELNALKASSSHLFKSTPTILSLEHENPDYAILNHLNTLQGELAILGRHGKGVKGLKSDLLGGTAETVIHHAHCSVLVVPITA